MNSGDLHDEDGDLGGTTTTPKASSSDDGEGRQLPPDLPRTLDDRRRPPHFGAETEMYDAWQGESQILTSPIVPAQPLRFNNLSLGPTYGDGGGGGGDDDDDETTQTLEEGERRLVGMLTARVAVAHRELEGGGDGSAMTEEDDEDDIAMDEKLSSEEKTEMLQKALNMAASNGDVQRITRLVGGKARTYVDFNAPDEDGTAPLIYASCFGHQDVVLALINAGADVDVQDRNQWSPLMWAMTNRHKAIAKILLDHGASPEVKSSTGRTAFDFVAPNSDISDYLQESGYRIGNVGVSDDFYSTGGFSQDRFEEEMAENEMKRRMMMESAMNLEVDLSSLGLDEQPESPGALEEEGQEFIWDRCLNDQMFVFQEHQLERILDIIITNMTPQRSPSQKPVPANILFLSARYAHYYASHDLLATLLIAAMDKINDVVEKHQWDMTILAFWISNATLLLHYLKKDAGLVEATTEFQLQLAELINEIFILIIRDAERRMDKNLDAAILDHETIPGFEDVHFQSEWRIFRSAKSKTKVTEPSSTDKWFRPPSPKRRAQISPRNITSLLSSTLFVLDLYDIHPVITSQIFAQLLYWLGAELFNRIMSNRKYLARTKAMQIRMNVSTIEDWARQNNRAPEHMENGTPTTSSNPGEDFVTAARRHLAPVIQLLQWLQCFSSLGESKDDDEGFESLIGTLQQLPRLSPQQLIHAVNHYRPEVGERSLSKGMMRYLIELQKEMVQRKQRHRKVLAANHNSHPHPPRTSSSTPSHHHLQKQKQKQNQNQPSVPPPLSNPTPTGTATPKPSNPTTTSSSSNEEATSSSTSTTASTTATSPDAEPPEPQQKPELKPDLDPYPYPEPEPDMDSDPTTTTQDNLLFDPSLMLPFSLPTSTDMLISYGAGLGGVNRERARKYIPTVPAEFLSRLSDIDGSSGNGNGRNGNRSGSMASMGSFNERWRRSEVFD
ncbi:MAG: hypothetical protein M1816_000864 [Peltula sp. TS41687]|nr:MAG: hypothetical protein M1816_000864 [Peltula sp. TS41687]